ncbi:hypothetical protein QQ045_005142 [Rhodiola kirilowii]
MVKRNVVDVEDFRRVMNSNNNPYQGPDEKMVMTKYHQPNLMKLPVWMFHLKQKKAKLVGVKC